MKQKKKWGRFVAGLLAAAQTALISVTAFAAVGPSSAAAQAGDGLELWYNKPATNYNWVSSSSTNPNDLQPLVVGNGYMGAAFYGALGTEKIQLSEKTLWKSGPDSRPDYNGGNKAGANVNLPALREAAFAYDQKTVDSIVNTGAFFGSVTERGSYQAFGDLNIEFDSPPAATPSDYKRFLDLENAVGGVEYTQDGVKYTREYLANYPENVLAFRLSASEAGKMNLSLGVDPLVTEKIGSGKETKVNVEKKVEHNDTQTVTFNLKSNNMKAVSQMKVLNQGGFLSATQDNEIRVDGADSVVVLLTIGTDYKNEYPSYKGEDPLPAVTERIEAAAQKGYDDLKAEHIADYRSLYGTVQLDLGAPQSGLTTDELLRQYQAAFKAGDLTDSKFREFEILAFQFGRYALISSSRPGALPANLQGVWNDNNSPMWSSDYHLNVNVEMNYWPAMSTNMADTMLSMIDYVDSLRAPGRVTAREIYGIEDGGWFTNCSNNIFGYTSPHDNYNYAFNAASNAWLCETIFEYYRFTGDEQILRDKLYPIMKEAAEGLSKLLVEDPRDGSLVIAPSFSSEHGPITVGTTYEQSLTYQLFKDVIESSKVVGDENDPLIATLSEQMERLDPIRIGEKGQIKEWREEDIVEISRLDTMEGEGNEEHRHTSHLLGLFPLSMITPETPEAFEAARVSLEKRGFGQTGWSRAMKMNEWARLLDGASSLKMYQGILAERTIANMFDTHPPFQIDGTLGLTSGVAEMLLQSHAGYIQPLPALPEEWGTGSYSGLSARGNFTVDAAWAGGSLTSMKLVSNKGAEAVLRYNSIAKAIVLDAQGNPVPFTVLDDNNISFATVEGETYTVTPGVSAPTTIGREAVEPRPEPVETCYPNAYQIPAGFEEIGVSERELPISRVSLPGNDGADIRMYYDANLGELSFIAYQLPAKQKNAVIEVISEGTGLPVARRILPVEHFSGLQADFQVPANLSGNYRLTISIEGEAAYVTRTFFFTAGESVYDLASLRQEYDRTSSLLARDYTDASWGTLQAAKANGLALIESEQLPSLEQMTTAREQLRMAREGLIARHETQIISPASNNITTEGSWEVSGGKLVSTTPGDSMTVEFYGEGIQLIGRANTDCGRIEVYLDGEYDKTVDLYTFESGNDNCVLYSARQLPLGNHTLTVQHAGGRDYATGQRVVLNQCKVDAPNQGNVVLGDNLLRGASVSVDPADATFDSRPGYEPDKCVDGDSSTRWATKDNTSPTLIFDLGGEKAFNRLIVKEAAGFINRVSYYEVEAFSDGAWKEIATGVGIGASCEIELPQTTASQLRIHFTTSTAQGVTLSEVELYQSERTSLEANNTAAAVAEQFTVFAPAIGADKLVTSAVPVGFEASLIASDNPEAVALDGTITPAAAEQQAVLTYRITKDADGTTADKQLTVTIPALPTEQSTESVAAALFVQQPSVGSTQLLTSVLPAGYRADIVASSHPEVIALDGRITAPSEQTAVTISIQVTKLSDGTTAQRSFSLTVPVEQMEEQTYLCNDPSVTYSTAISSGTTGVRNQWFYSSNASDLGGKVLAYNYQSGELPWFEIEFSGEQISLLNRTKNDQANISVTITDSEGNVVAGPTEAVCTAPNGAYQQVIYTSPALKPGSYILRGVGQPTKAGQYTILNAYKVSGRTSGTDADKQALSEAIHRADSLITAGAPDRVDSAHKWAFMTAYNTAVAARDSITAGQDAVDQACSALETAISVLEGLQPDKTALDELIQEAQALEPGDYQDFAAVEAALKEAKQVSENPYATQSQIAAAADALREAIDSLKPVEEPSDADKTILNKVIEKAEALKRTDEFTNAISSVQASFNTALDAAKEVSADVAATEKEVQDAWITLMAEIHKLGLQQGNKDALRENYELYKELNLDLYIDNDAKENFVTALANAEAMLGNDDAVQSEVDAVNDALVAAANALTRRGDKSALQTLVDSTLGFEKDSYAVGWDAFETARSAANAVLADKDATQDEVNTATDALLKAMLELRYKADKELLNKVIASARTLDLSGYSAQSVEAFQAALDAAQQAVDNQALSQDDQAVVDKALSDLTEAIQGLQHQDGTPARLSVDGDGGITRSARTGEAVPAAAVVLLLAAGTLSIAKRKKKI